MGRREEGGEGGGRKKRGEGGGGGRERRWKEACLQNKRRAILWCANPPYSHHYPTIRCHKTFHFQFQFPTPQQWTLTMLHITKASVDLRM